MQAHTRDAPDDPVGNTGRKLALQFGILAVVTPATHQVEALALLGKQYGVTPKGWQVAAGEFGQPGTYLSVADIVDAGSLGQVRSHKRQRKAAAKAEGKAPT